MIGRRQQETLTKVAQLMKRSPHGWITFHVCPERPYTRELGRGMAILLRFWEGPEYPSLKWWIADCKERHSIDPKIAELRRHLEATMIAEGCFRCGSYGNVQVVRDGKHAAAYCEQCRESK